MTASSSTSQKSAIFDLMAAGRKRSVRQRTMSGWIPIARSSFTECWVALVLSSPDALDERHQGEVDVDDVLPAHVLLELADRLEERQALDVAHGAADLDDLHVDALADPPDRRLDLVGDVGDDLDGAPEIVAAPLAGDDRVVDLAGRDVVVAGHPRAGEPLVVAQVEVGLPAVVRDEHLPVLVGAHRPGVHVDVRVHLLERDREATGFQQAPDGRGGQPLAEGRHHATRHEDVLGRHDQPPPLPGWVSGRFPAPAAPGHGAREPA